MSFVVSILITFMCQNYFMTEKFVTNNFVMRHSFLYCLSFFLIGGLIFRYKSEIEILWNDPNLGINWMLEKSGMPMAADKDLPYDPF